MLDGLALFLLARFADRFEAQHLASTHFAFNLLKVLLYHFQTLNHQHIVELAIQSQPDTFNDHEGMV